MSFFLKFYFLLLPFQWALSPIEGVDLAIIRPITLGLGLFWLVRGCMRGEIRLLFRAGLFFFCSFLFMVSLSYFWSINSSFSVRKIMFLLSFAPLFLVLLDFFQDTGRCLFVLRSYVVGALVAATAGIIIFFSQFIFGVQAVFIYLTTNTLPFFLGHSFGQIVQQYPSLLVNVGGKTLLRASGFFPDPHMYAFYIGMAIPVALGFFLLADKSERWKWLAAIGLLILVDLLTFSRGAYVGLLGASLVWFMTSNWLKHLILKRKMLVMAWGVLFFGLLFFTPFPHRFYSSFSQYDGSNIERIRLWHEAINHIAEQPLLGVGVGNYPLVVKPSATYRDPIYVHNLYLDIAVEIGGLGLAFFLLLLFGAIGHSWLRWRNKGDTIGYVTVLSLVIFSAHALFETPLYSVHVLPILLLFLALGTSRYIPKRI